MKTISVEDLRCVIGLVGLGADRDFRSVHAVADRTLALIDRGELMVAAAVLTELARPVEPTMALPAPARDVEPGKSWAFTEHQPTSLALPAPMPVAIGVPALPRGWWLERLESLVEHVNRGTRGNTSAAIAAALGAPNGQAVDNAKHRFLERRRDGRWSIKPRFRSTPGSTVAPSDGKTLHRLPAGAPQGPDRPDGAPAFREGRGQQRLAPADARSPAQAPRGERPHQDPDDRGRSDGDEPPKPINPQPGDHEATCPAGIAPGREEGSASRASATTSGSAGDAVAARLQPISGSEPDRGHQFAKLPERSLVVPSHGPAPRGARRPVAAPSTLARGGNVDPVAAGVTVQRLPSAIELAPYTKDIPPIGAVEAAIAYLRKLGSEVHRGGGFVVIDGRRVRPQEVVEFAQRRGRNEAIKRYRADHPDGPAS